MKIGAGKKREAKAQRIFLIDPDIAGRSALYFMLPDGHNIHEFDSLAQIAEMPPQRMPDLVIVNALLIAGHGKELIQGWRMAWPGVRVFVVCEASGLDCLVAAKAAGADDTLWRPFNVEAVHHKVAGAASRSATPALDIALPPERQDKPLHVGH